jgi:hypothetical protein
MYKSIAITKRSTLEICVESILFYSKCPRNHYGSGRRKQKYMEYIYHRSFARGEVKCVLFIRNVSRKRYASIN